MNSNYNSGPHPAEVMVDGDKVHLVRARERSATGFATPLLTEARRGLQPRCLRFLYSTMPAKLQNVADEIINPVRLWSHGIP